MKKKIDSVHFQHFSPFFIILMEKLIIFKLLMCTLFDGGGGSEKVYVLYTHLYVDNYGRPLKLMQTSIKTIYGCWDRTSKRSSLVRGLVGEE